MWGDGNYFVYNNMWDNTAGTQRLYACSYHNWYVVAVQPSTANVKTYPNVQENFNLCPYAGSA